MLACPCDGARDPFSQRRRRRGVGAEVAAELAVRRARVAHLVTWWQSRNIERRTPRRILFFEWIALAALLLLLLLLPGRWPL